MGGWGWEGLGGFAKDEIMWRADEIPLPWCDARVLERTCFTTQLILHCLSGSVALTFMPPLIACDEQQP